MGSLGWLGRYLFGPSLYRIYHLSAQGQRTMGRDYEQNGSEYLAESFLKTISYAVNVIYYCTPIVAFYVYRWGVLSSSSSVIYLTKVCATVYLGVAGAYVLRAYGRMGSADYKRFLDILDLAKADLNNRASLQLYDFDFRAWPVDFRYDESSFQSRIRRNTSNTVDERTSFLSRLFSLPVDIFDYLLVHGIGRPMTYPGSVKLLQTAMAAALQQGRTMLIQKNGLRGKLLAADGNEIDTMFIDKRSDNPGDEGNTLVICCEGNAAYYEVGCMGTPLKAGYSVLGWNHPGFFGSTGLPFPEAERNAVDVVVRYAVSRLGFSVKDIVFFAWSIGGFTASYAAMIYPEIKALILDATFDNIRVLAQSKMPNFLGSTVERVMKNYLDLDVGKYLIRYPGPVRFIRRSREEILTTLPGDASTNRGNHLLVQLLRHRYPNIVTEPSLKVLDLYLQMPEKPAQDAVLARVGFNTIECETRLRLATRGVRPLFPSDVGADWPPDFKTRVTLYLALKYMDHYDATHCMPLPSSYFELPWDHN